ncbi:chemotaxis protein [Bordetella genomosp. 1]|uniref:Chemotaxis protein n=1 Tax=Bordetella genomosp. 1 TaxID=1395607 RepID=A0A261RW16_9BORD|nr:DUF802 domain-containing protein [Bordetella genomosp. 1]OZI29279.1 chemotaxis protein [Bordetella genomosp. 1]
MIRSLISVVVFLAGLAAVVWIGAGYAGSNPLALAVTLTIGAFYVIGAIELLRYHRATQTLVRSVNGLEQAPADLAAWIASLPAALRVAVRQRIEGERVALPAPALTPYIVGLLVLLGMLGTFLGMVATLRGTGVALESATDLQAIRASLAAPVKGLGFAFGTSVAGVATSAMLGLLGALIRRERIAASQQLDARIITTLRPYSAARQREESHQLMLRQAEVMPALVDRLQAMMENMERHQQALGEQLKASQSAFHDKAEAVYTRLAGNVQQAMQDGAAASARAAGEAIRPAIESTLSNLARDTTAWHDTVTAATQQHLDGMSARFDRSATDMAAVWQQALDQQQRANQVLTDDLRASLEGYAQTFDTRAATLLDGVSDRLETTTRGITDTLQEATGAVARTWTEALERQERVGAQLAGDNQQALARAAATFQEHAGALLGAVNQSNAELQNTLASRDEERLSAWAESLHEMSGALRQQWQESGAQSAVQQAEIVTTLVQTARESALQMQEHASGTLAQITALAERLAATTAQFEQHAGTLADRLDRSHGELHARLAATDAERLQTFTGSLQGVADALRTQWQETGVAAAERQQDICDALARSAEQLAVQAREQASQTHAELARISQSLASAATTFESHSDGLLSTLSASHTSLQDALASRDEARLAAWAASMQGLADTLRNQWQQTGNDHNARHDEIVAALALAAEQIGTQSREHASQTHAELDRIAQSLARAAATFESHSGGLLSTLSDSHASLQQALAERDEARLAAWAASMQGLAETLRDQWQQTGAEHNGRHEEIVTALALAAEEIGTRAREHAGQTHAELDRIAQSLAAAANTFERHSGGLLSTLTDSHASLQQALAERDEARLAAWAASMQSLAEELRTQWQQAGADQEARNAAIVATLERTAGEITAQAESQASATIAEIGQLVQVAAQAPQAAADVVAELRQKLSDSMVRDNAMLEERARLLETLDTLLEAVNHASAEQRVAVDALISSSADLLDRVGNRFNEQVENETGKLTGVAEQITSSSAEVASLGEAMGAAVQLYGEANETLVEQLQRIEAALDKSLSRSDDQLAYYVAQAREVVDLSMLSQKQILEELQLLNERREAERRDIESTEAE